MLLDTLVQKIKTILDNSLIDEVIILVVLIAFTESVAQAQLKNQKLITGMVIYMAVGYILHHSYHTYALSKVNVLWSSLSIVLATLLGYMLYDEKITQNSIIAVCMALGAVYFSNRVAAT